LTKKRSLQMKGYSL